MPYNQNGPNASTMAGTYNDVAGTQTNNISGGGSPGNMPEVGIQPGANVARFGTYNDVGGDQHNVTKVGTIRSLAIDGANQVTSYFERFKNTGNIVYNTNNTTNNSSQHTAGDSFTDARTTNNYNSISPGSGSSSYFPPLQDKDNTNTIRPISIPLVYDDLDQLADPNKAADDTPRSPPPLFHGSVTNRSTLRQQSNNELPKPPPKDDPVLEVEIPELRRRVQQLNDDIELCAIDIAGLYGQYLGHKLKHTKLAGFHTAVTELIRPGQERDATGVEVAIPCLQSLFSATLAQKIMEPFAPGIDADTNTQLSSIYRIVSSNEPRELRAIWRSITYKSCIHGRSSDGYATILSNEIVQVLRSFFFALLPPGTFGNRPRIPEGIRQRIKKVVLDALALQDHLQMSSQDDWRVFFPAPAARLDATFVELTPIKGSQNEESYFFWKAGGRQSSILAAFAVKLGLCRTISDGGKSSGVVVKAGIILV